MSDRAKAIFVAAIQKAAPERADWVQDACQGDADLLHRVSDLLSAHVEADDSFLEHPAMRVAGRPAIPSAADGILGDFRLVREIGRGGMGIVYEAQQISLKRRVALKVLPFAAVLDNRQLQRFRTEAMAAARLHHQHIVPVFQVGCERAVHFYAMQYVEGQNIAQLLHGVRLASGPDSKPVDLGPTLVDPASGVEPSAPVAETALFNDISTDYSHKKGNFHRRIVTLGIQAAEALDYAHQQGILHRDIKPSNLMLDAAGNLWITDFGLARIEGDDGLTMSGDLLGTLRYMSPEQVLGKRVVIDQRTDVYSLGVSLYEMLSLKPAYQGSERAELLRQISFEQPLPLRKHDASIPADLETIVHTAMAREPHRRYETAQELADDLQRFLDGKPIVAKPPSHHERARKWVARNKSLTVSVAVVLVALFASAAAIAVAIRKQPHSPPGATTGSSAMQPVAGIAPLPRAPHKGQYLPGLIPEPQIMPAVGRWQIATVAPRGLMKGVAWSPDGRQIAFGEAGNIRICDATNLRLLHILVGHTRPVSSIAWSPDGKTIASSSWDGTVRLWSSDGIPLYELTGHTGRVHAVTWSPDSKQLASAGLDQTIRLWGADGTAGRVITGHTQSVNSVAWSPDGRWLASAAGDLYCPEGDDNTVRLWKSDGTPLRVLGHHDSPVYCVAWSPDSRRIAAGNGELRTHPGTIRIWELDGSSETVLKGGGNVTTVCWRPVGHELAWAGAWYWKVWQSSFDGRKNRSWPLPNLDPDTDYGVNSVAWSPDGSQLAIISSRSIQITSADGRPKTGLKSTGSVFVGIDWHPDGTQIASSGSQLWSWAADGTSATRLSPHYAHYLDWSPDGQTLAWADVTDGVVPLLRLDGTTAVTLRAYGAFVSWSPDGERVAVGTPAETEVQIYNADGTVAGTLSGHNDRVRYCAWSPDGEWLGTVSWGENGNVRLWSADGAAGPVMHGHRIAVHGVASSPEGDWIASAGEDGTVRLWRREGQAGTVLPHQAVVYTVTWSPDGRWLATGSKDGLMRIWDATRLWESKPEPIQVVPAHQGWVHSASWSPDSTRIATASFYDGSIRVWNRSVGRTEWVGLLLSDGTAAAFDPSGSVLYGDHSRLSRDMLYLREQPTGAIQILTTDEFEQEFGADRVSELLQADKYREACELFDRVAATDTEQNIIWAAVVAETFQAHRDHARTVIALSGRRNMSTGSNIYTPRSAAYLALKEYDKALADITSAVDRNPGDINNFLGFDQSLVWDSPPDVQQRFFELVTRAIELSPANYVVRASYYHHRGEHDKALADLESALKSSPDDAALLNNIAWHVAKNPEHVSSAPWAVELAQRAVDRKPQEATYLNTLGVAQYRAGEYQAAITSLLKSKALGSDTMAGWDCFFLSMAESKLQHRTAAEDWYRQAAAWMDSNAPENEELIRFRAEAEQLLGIDGAAAGSTAPPIQETGATDD